MVNFGNRKKNLTIFMVLIIFIGANDYSMYEVYDNYSINSKCSDSSASSYVWYKKFDFEFVYDVSIDEKYYDYHFDDDMHI